MTPPREKRPTGGPIGIDDLPTVEAVETEDVPLLSYTEKRMVSEPEWQKARADYPIGSRVIFLGRKFKIYGMKRHKNGDLMIVLRLTGKECKKYPTANRYVDVRYQQYLRALQKIE